MSFCKIVLAPSGCYALLVREKIGTSWVQVKACLSESAAQSIIDLYDLEYDEDERAEIIFNNYDENWGSDAGTA